jgi:membrane protein DedA with SNARE-associated domain
MVESIINWIVAVISQLGYPGIIVTMAIESALIPLPSEIIMPFSGFLVSQGRFEFWIVGLCGAIGNLLGSWIAYGLGYWGEGAIARRFVRSYGKFILLSEEELNKAERLFRRFGNLIVFGSRVMPAVRTIISLPCGMARLPFLRFSLLTFFGSLIWSYFLAYLGVLLGKNWEILRPIFRKFDIVIILVIIIGIGWYFYHKLKPAFKSKI